MLVGSGLDSGLSNLDCNFDSSSSLVEVGVNVVSTLRSGRESVD